MYSLLLIICLGTRVGASIDHRFAQGARKFPLHSLQNDASPSKDFASKPAGSPPTGAANQVPTQGNPSPFQSQPAGQSPSQNQPNPPSSHPSAPPSSVPDATVPAPPVSPLLSSLMRARNPSISFADRQTALVDAMNAISKLPAADQARYAELAAAARQRIAVESFLSNSGQAQGVTPAQPK